MKLSYSAIRTYLECPFRYRLTYIERLPTRTRPYMKLANALHYTLERFHRDLVGNVQRRASSVERHQTDGHGR